MNKRLVNTCLLLMTAVFFNPVLADPGTRDAITNSLKKVLPGVTPDEISPSPIKGVSEVQLGPRLLYVTNDGKYLFQGSLIDLETLKDISEDRRQTMRLDAVNALGEDKMIIFPAKKPRHTITVFTDIDCGYCRKLHNEVDKYNERGITVRYLMYPRAGVGSPAYDKAVSVWCEEDRRQALTDAKAGKQLPKRECLNPVKEEYELGQQIGIRGTPAIILDDGALLPGYIPADKLAKSLDSGP